MSKTTSKSFYRLLWVDTTDPGYCDDIDAATADGWEPVEGEVDRDGQPVYGAYVLEDDEGLYDRTVKNIRSLYVDDVKAAIAAAFPGCKVKVTPYNDGNVNGQGAYLSAATWDVIVKRKEA